MKRLIAAALLAAGAVAMATPAAAQPMHSCGGENLPPPLPLSSRCHWACVNEPVGPPRLDRPQQMRQHWKKICPPASPAGASGGGKAEIKKKNVPQVKPNNPPKD